MEQRSKKTKSYKHAIKLLSKKDYSVHKMKTKLLDKSFDEFEVDETINELIEQNYLREEEYVRQRVRGLFYKNYSSSYIIQKLAQEYVYIDQDFIDKLKEEWGVDEDDLAANLIHKRTRNLSSEPEDLYKLKVKIRRKLESKGFSSGRYVPEIDKVLNNL